MIESVIKTHKNGALIAEIAPLWLADRPVVLDLTYGKGRWWTEFEPAWLVRNDLDPSADTDYHEDFTKVPEVWHGVYDAVAFDPPYIAKGGRETSGIKDFDARYGLYGAPKDPATLWPFIACGIVQGGLCLKRGGVLLVKCMDYISSGRYQFGLGGVVAAGEAAGLRLVDLFIHASRPGPQPKGRRQVHSRRSHSYLVVLQK